jgi:hypothetical protein
MSLATVLSNAIAGIESDLPTIEAAFGEASRTVGVALGLGEVVLEAADPALTPVVTPLVSAANAALSAAQNALDNAAGDAQTATSAVATLATAAISLGNVAADGITAIANNVKNPAAAPTTPPTALSA